MNKKISMLLVLIPLIILFIYVAFSSGPLAPIPVVVTEVSSGIIKPAISGIGTVEAQHLYKLSSTHTARIQSLTVDVGDWVSAGHVVATLDPIDLNAKIDAQQAAIQRIQAIQQDAELKLGFAKSQTIRYTQLLVAKATQEEQLAIKKQEQRLAESALSLITADMKKARADLLMLEKQQQEMQLIAPISGRVAARLSEVGNVLVTGQPLLELYDPKKLWVQSRFEQIHAQNLVPNLPVTIQLRAQKGSFSGRVARIEPKADVVTEEMLAKIVMDDDKASVAHIGELANMTVMLPERRVALRIPNAAIQRQKSIVGVWLLNAQQKISFRPITLGIQDLDGQVEVLSGLSEQDRIVHYSQKPLSSHHAIVIVEQLVDQPS
jgi:HlyD family secretion protein